MGGDHDIRDGFEEHSSDGTDPGRGRAVETRSRRPFRQGQGRRAVPVTGL